MRKYFNDLKDLVLTNGGKIALNGKTYVFLNTCSIDYLFISILVYKIPTDRVCSLDNCFRKIQTFLKNNNWDMARLEWAIFSKIEPTENLFDGSFTYNFLETLNYAFLDLMEKYQEFSYEYKCPNQKCSVNSIAKTDVSSKFFMR